MHLQEFWVKRRGRPKVIGVRYKGAARANPTKEVESAIEKADRIVFCPANPVTSIGPMIAIRGLAKLLRRSRARRVALSPMIGDAPVSGPAGKLLRARGVRVDSVGVASLYRGFIDSIVVDGRDVGLQQEILGLGLECHLSDIVIRGPRDERRMAKELLEA